MEERNQLRKRILTARDNLGPEAAAKGSRRVCGILQQIPELAKARVIMAYAPARNEVDTTLFWADTMQDDRVLVLPRVEDRELVPVRFSGWENTKRSSFGIREPMGEPYPSQDIEVVLVPGVVFDRNGYRLGYGQGFYDRFLPTLDPATIFIGIAYDFQVVDDTYPRKHDVRVDFVITERGKIDIKW